MVVHVYTHTHSIYVSSVIVVTRLRCIALFVRLKSLSMLLTIICWLISNAAILLCNFVVPSMVDRQTYVVCFLNILSITYVDSHKNAFMVSRYYFSCAQNEMWCMISLIFIGVNVMFNLSFKLHSYVSSMCQRYNC